MAYIYEAIPPSGWKQLMQLNPVIPFGIPGYWVVDATRKIVFLGLGGRGESSDRSDHPPDFYLLVVEEKLIYFQAWHTVQYQPDGTTYEFEIENMSVGGGGTICSMIQEEIREALLVYRRGLRPTKHVKSVHVKFPAQIRP